MTRSSNRRKRGAVTAATKKAAQGLAKDNGIDITKEVSLDPAMQGVRIAALEKAVQKLVQVQQINHGEIHRAFSMTDAHLWVLRRLCEDIVSDMVIKVPSNLGANAVDMGAYYDLYNTWLRQQQQAAAEAQARQQHGANAGSEAKDEDVFGGDLSDENPERDEAVEQGQSAGEVGSQSGDAPVAMPSVHEAGVAPAGA